MPPSQVVLCYNCDLMELYTNVTHFFPLYFYNEVFRAKMGVHVFMIELGQPDNWYPRKLKIVKIYVQSQWRVVLIWYHRFWQSSVQRGRRTKFCIISSLKWIIQICSKFYRWVSKITFHSPTPHCCWGNFPFNSLASFSFLYLFLH